MKTFIIFLYLFIFCYDKSQGCGSCFPGTSSSLCPYRKPTDPIVCCNDGKKYTPCTYNCVKSCNPGLTIVGCTSNCVTTYGTSCPPTPVTITTTSTLTPITAAPSTTTSTTISPVNPIITPSTPTTTTTKSPETITTVTTTTNAPECKETTDIKCQFPSKPDNSCQVPTMKEQCERCVEESPATGGCASVDFCYNNDIQSICDVPFDPSECDLDSGSEACITCPPDSPAKGRCI